MKLSYSSIFRFLLISVFLTSFALTGCDNTSEESFKPGVSDEEALLSPRAKDERLPDGEKPLNGEERVFFDGRPSDERELRGDRPPRGEREFRGDRPPRGEREVRGERPPKGDRPPRGERPPRPDSNSQDMEDAEY